MRVITGEDKNGKARTKYTFISVVWYSNMPRNKGYFKWYFEFGPLGICWVNRKTSYLEIHWKHKRVFPIRVTD